MYERAWKTMKSLKVFFNFRPTYFSYFRKITAISISYTIVVHPRSQGVKLNLMVFQYSGMQKWLDTIQGIQFQILLYIFE